MATFDTYKLRDGTVRHRAAICLKGIRDSFAANSKQEVRAWATRREAEILASARGEAVDRPFADALARYRDEVSVKKRGSRWESVRINMLLAVDAFGEPVEGKTPDPITQVSCKEFGSQHVAAWRDRRLAAGLRPASVRREWNLISAVCSTAQAEWRWLAFNPFAKGSGVKRPPHSKRRRERFSQADLDALQAAANAHSTDTYRRVMQAVRFAIETAMRKGEILFLGENPGYVDTERRVAHLPVLEEAGVITWAPKNGCARDVPLSAEAVRIWEETGGRWGFDPEALDVHWRDLRLIASRIHLPVARLHFHDTRHEAISRLAKKLHPLELARMTGHNNINELLTYYDEDPAAIAMKL